VFRANKRRSRKARCVVVRLVGSLSGLIRYNPSAFSNEFYEHGRQSSLLDVLSLGDARGAVRRKVQHLLAAWLGSMAAVSREAGASARQAHARAQQAMVLIQGSLILARATEDRKPFARALADLPRVLTRG